MSRMEINPLIAEKKQRPWLLILVFLIGLSLRLYGINWGMPHYFHPDERQIMFQVTDVSLKEPNPHFFAYGSFPIYLLKGVVVSLDTVNRSLNRGVKSLHLTGGIQRFFNEYFPPINHFKGMTLTGRALSAIMSAWTILAVFNLACLVYNRKIAYIAATLFAFTVLSIQQAHFYVVDTPQALLMVFALYYIVRTGLQNRSRDYYYSGIFIGLAMATKISSLPVYLAYFMAQVWSNMNRKKTMGSWINWTAGIVLSIVVMTAAMPYWIITYDEFIRDVQAQSNMVNGTVGLPYTIQYEHTAPFIYLIKNMVCWSMGLPLGLAAMIGLIYAVIRFFSRREDLANRIILTYVIPLFILNSTFKAKFLRYTLPLMPFLVIFAAKWLYDMVKSKKWWARPVQIVVIAGAVFWSLAFVNIYNFKDTRIQASEWIYKNIPRGATVLIESNWDDTLPVSIDSHNSSIYTTKKLEIYSEPDSEQKAAVMANTLESGDVIVLASKRHYGSTLRVPDRYPIAGNFYRSLFAEKLGYRFAGCFEAPPQIGPLKFRDETADESFSVYEHPKVLVFQKETALVSDQIFQYLVAPPPEVKALTYNDILTARPPTSVGSSVEFPIWRWILALEVIGWSCMPVAFLIFKKFDHKGYPLSKVIGLLVCGYLAWLTPHLHWLPFSQSTILLLISIVLVLNILIYLTQKKDILAFFQTRWWSVVSYELVFFAVFILFIILKSLNPNIYWSESSMDFGFMNSILRSDYFPPLDPWITDEPINYYYFGHYLAAFLTKLSGVTAGYGYNLFFATIPALVALSISSIVISLTRRVWAGCMGIILSVVIGNLDGLVQVSRILMNWARNTGWAVYASSFESFVGIFFFLGRSERQFRFFRSAHELIQPTVHEFPFWSYNFMDLHAHTIATLISTFVIALQLVYFRNRKRGFNVFGEGLGRWITLVVSVIAFGALYPTNSWDFPTHCLLFFLILNLIREPVPALAPHLIRSHAEPPREPVKPDIPASIGTQPEFETAPVDFEKIPDAQTEEIADQAGVISEQKMVPESAEPVSLENTTDLPPTAEICAPPKFENSNQTPSKPRRRMGDLLAAAADNLADRLQFNLIGILIPFMVLLVGCVWFYWPYWSYFTRSGMGIGWVHQYKQTTNLDGFLTMFGLFLFIFTTILVRWWFSTRRRRGQSVPRILLTGALYLLPFIIFLILGYVLLDINYSVLALCLFLMAVIAAIYYRLPDDQNLKFGLLMAFMAVAIPAGCEVIFIRDFYQGGDHRRFNTIFKFYMQAWFFFSIASAFLLVQRYKVRAALAHLSAWRPVKKTARWIWFIAFILLLGSSLIFTVAGPLARRHHDEYGKTPQPLTLDGFSYLKTSTLNDVHAFDLNENTYRAIDWLNRNVQGTPVILEASGADYLYSYGRISGNTGLPTVLGWWSHVDQREYKRDYGRMKRDIQEMYEGLSIPNLLKTLRRYGVRYIYVGNTEKKDYNPIGLQKFSELTDYMTPVYANSEVTIYQVNDYGLNVDFAKVAADSNAMKDLQERLMEEERREIQRKEEAAARRKEELANAQPLGMFHGTEGEARGQFQEPRSLAVDSDGTVYVADFRNHRIQKFDPTGQWLAMWGSTGNGEGRFNDICDVAVDSDGVYVVDTFNNRIQKFTKDGRFIAVFDRIPGNLFYPRAAVTDGKGRIFIADTGHSRIVVMKNNGEFIKDFGSMGKNEGEFDNPIGLHIAEDRLYVVDSKNLRIQIFNLEGEFQRSFEVKGWSGDVFVEPYVTTDVHQRIWVTDPTANRIFIYDPAGKLLKTIDQTNSVPFAHPMGIAASPDGKTILVVDTHHHRLRAIPVEQD